MSKAQPKIVQKTMIRFVIGLFLIAAMLGLYSWWRSLGANLDFGSAETGGDISAIERLPGRQGQIAVLIKPNGDVVRAPSHPDDVSDRDLVWRPDGQRLLFASNREKGVYNVWQWKPESNSVERMTVGSRGQSQPTYSPDAGSGSQPALMISGGVVVEFDPKEQTRRQVLPPVNRDMQLSSGPDDGQQGQFTGVYAQLGTSFKSALWTPGKGFIAAVMRRDDGTEALILQNMNPTSDEDARPVPIAAGDSIDFDVDPTSGKVVYAVQNFHFVQITPDMLDEQGKLLKKFQTVPFTHLIGIVDPANISSQDAGGVVVASREDKICFGSPRISPDGASLLFVEGPFKDGQLAPQELDSVPCRRNASQAVTRLVRGELYEPSWSPDGSRVTFAMRNASNRRAICTVNSNGSHLTDLTADKGDFSFPRFSPQTK